MPTQITGGSYVLAVKNIDIATAFYIDHLGFSIYWDEGFWKCLIRDNVKLILGECPDEIPAADTGCHSYFAYFEIRGIDAMHEELIARGTAILSPIEDKAWRQREFSVRTPDGHRITFGEPIAHIVK